MAFDTLKFWIDMYNTVASKQLSCRVGEISNEKKVAFNRAIAITKRQHGLSTEDIKLVIYYMYKHNPLQLENIADNGKIANLDRSVTHFKYWRSQHRDLIESVGVYKAIDATIIKYTKVDKFLNELVDELMSAYNE